MITVSSGSARFSTSSGPAFSVGAPGSPATRFLSKALRVSHCVLQIVLIVLILVDADGDYVSCTFALERVGAREHERRVLALHVVAIERVRHQPVWTSS